MNLQGPVEWREDTERFVDSLPVDPPRVAAEWPQRPIVVPEDTVQAQTSGALAGEIYRVIRGMIQSLESFPPPVPDPLLW